MQTNGPSPFSSSSSSSSSTPFVACQKKDDAAQQAGIGSIYVGRREYIFKRGKQTFVDHVAKGTHPVLCLTPSTEFGSLSPYVMRDENGNLLENAWQFRKIYKTVPDVETSFSKYEPDKIIWKREAERHVDEKTGKVLDAYWRWRLAGISNEYPVRYPVTFRRRGECQSLIYLSPEEEAGLQAGLFPDLNLNGKEDGSDPRFLGIVDARKKVYVPLYEQCIARTRPRKYLELLEMVKQGRSITIVEVDGPKQSLLDHYKETHGVPDDFIREDVMLATDYNLDIMLKDTKASYGHGYCLARCLLNDLDKKRKEEEENEKEKGEKKEQ